MLDHGRDAPYRNVLMRFAEKLTSPIQTVLDCSFTRGDIALMRNGVLHRLHAGRRPVSRLIREESNSPSWGPGVVATEGAARYLLEHWIESVETHPASKSHWWIYNDGYFEASSRVRLVVRRLLCA